MLNIARTIFGTLTFLGLYQTANWVGSSIPVEAGPWVFLGFILISIWGLMKIANKIWKELSK
jgi:hypothetical protein